MKRTRAACMISTALWAAAGARADQLAWISEAQAEAAVARLPAGSIVVSYCSMCDDRPEVWSVDRASVVPASDGKHYQVRIDGRLLARARSIVKQGTYTEPVDFESPPGRRLRKEVDLAYLYVRETGERFRVLAHVLGFPCEAKVRDVGVPASAMVMRAAPRGSVAATLHISAAARRDAEDSAEDIRKYVQENRSDVFTVVDDPDDAEVALVVQRREIRKGQGTDLTGQAAPKDFYEIFGRVTVQGEVGSLEGSQEFVSFAAWRDAAKAFASELESYVEARQHRVLQARLGFPALGGTIEEMNDEWRKRLGVRKAKGAAFVEVEPEGPAATAGILPGDCIVEVDGKKTKHAWDVARMVWERGPGAQLRLKLKRDDAERSVVLKAGTP